MFRLSAVQSLRHVHEHKVLRLCCLFTATNHLAEEKAKQDGAEVFGPFNEREKLGSKDAPGDVAITWETPAVHVLRNVNIYALRLPWDTIFNIFRCEIFREKNSLETRRRPVL